jgi:hypothetical protein
MPSTFSPSLRIELIGDGEQDGIWGQTTNNNLGTLLEQAITGITTVDVTSGNATLTSYNGTLDEARSAVLIVNGSNAVTRNITIPNEPKTYIVTNNTSQNVGIKTVSGAAFTCSATTQTTLYCDGNDNVYGASILTSPPTYETFVNPLITGIREATTVSATAATGTINFDTLTQAVLYYTTNASGNWTVNFRGDGSTTLNSLMGVGQSFATSFLVTQGATAYYNTAVTIDGSAVTPKWQSIAPSFGNASSIDVYTYVIIKTASATFTVFASQTKFV